MAEIEAARLVESANRAKEGMKKDTQAKTAILACLALGNLILAIPALVISYRHESDPCVGHFQGIRFEYPTWLLVYGWTEIAESGIALCGVALSCATASEVPLAMVIALDALCVMFHFAWYIVGAILLFTEITPSCARCMTSAWRCSF
jgi:hypothetical protein